MPPRLTRAAGSRTPKNGVHSAPEYVVGIETIGRSRSADTALAVSIALPPPSATSPSASSAAAVAARTLSASVCGRTPSKRRSTGSAASRQRALVISSGRSLPSSPSTCGNDARPQRTIIGRGLSRAAARASPRAPAQAPAEQVQVAARPDLVDDGGLPPRLGQVEAGGIEPPTSACKADVFPLAPRPRAHQLRLGRGAVAPRAEISNYEIFNHWFDLACDRIVLEDDVRAVLRSSYREVR